MPKSQRLLIDQTDITQTSSEHITDALLEDGQVRLKLQSFALTVNNVTYAATGFVIGYWKFFPTDAKGQGVLPVWGVAEVSESRAEGLETGTRLYGFYPMAEELVIAPKPAAETVFIDQTPHRADLPLVYNSYTVFKGGDAQHDHLRALLQPLLATSYLLFDWLKDNDWFGAEQIIVGSASSKTGLGLCKFLAEDEGGPRCVGLPSEGNRAFVEGLKACDEVKTYGEITQISGVPSVYVDMAGNAEIKSTLHHHLGDNMKYSAAVGTSHWDKFAQPEPMPGAKPRFFFAPEQIRKRREEWGPGVIEAQITAAWKRVASGSQDWLNVVEHHGLDAAADTYARLARGEMSPRDGHVVTL